MATSQINALDKDGNTVALDSELAGGKQTPQHGIRDGMNEALGARADAPAASDTGTASLIALVKRLLGKVTAQFPAALGAAAGAASFSVVPNTDTPFPVVGNVAHDAPDSGKGVKVAYLANSSAPAAVSAGDRADAWGSTAGASVVAGVTYTLVDGIAKSAMTFPRANSTTGLPQTAIGYFHNGTTLDLVVGSAAAGAVVKPYALPGSDWSYAAAAGGILNTTAAVTIKAAAGAGLRNYITQVDIATDGPLANATELAIRDGAGGTVLWRTRIGTACLPGGRSIALPTPLRGSANTLLEVVTLTASGTGAVHVNAGGYSAA